MGKKVRRLFEQFQPEHYQLELHLNRQAMTFSGMVTIRGKKIGRPSQRLTFHQKELKITSAKVVKHDKKAEKPLEVARINNQNSFDEVRLHTDEMVYPGEYSVTIEFEGKITKPMNGIYPCFFKYKGKEKMLIATQFESHHAREAFPNIDEPEAKATFDLTLTTPVGETVLANTPVKQQTIKGKQQVTSFETTPRMSSYLLAFVYGEMAYKEASTKDGVAVRTYATPDNAVMTEHALKAAVKALEFFSDYFGTAYPLPKLDMVALPDFSSGAMENWGLVTYRESIMLVDPKHSSIESKQIAVLVIAHELSHQWFGNLVTMKWWDDLWLNESFANLMEYRATDALHPEWQIWEQFVSHETAAAKRRDSLQDVQSVHTDVNHPDEISTLFDPSIVYAKGGSILYMLFNHIGEKAFTTGLKAYFAKHAYSNTQASDLWNALSQASGQDIDTFMEKWLTKPGYPLISVDWEPGSDKLELEQRRFLSDPTAESSDNLPWQVPLAATVELSLDLLDKKQASLHLETQVTPLLFNHDGQSYYLPQYTDQNHLKQIRNALQKSQVETIDRFLLLDNYNLLQRGGESSMTDLLDLMLGFENETSETVWGALTAAAAEARKLVETEPSSDEKLDSLIEKLVLPVAENLGWDDRPDESAQTLRLRGLTVALAASAKSQPIVKEGLRRFAGFRQPSDLSPSTRSVVYFCGSRYGSQFDFIKLLKLYKTIQSADEKDELAAGITAAKSPAAYNQSLKLLKSEYIRRQDLMHWFGWLLRNRYSRQAAWQWLVNNWDWVWEQYASDKSVGYFARFCGNVFTTKAELKQFKNFFGPKRKIVAMARDIALAEQEINSRIVWRQRNEKAVKAWLAKT